jgi:PAS domain S-box-containing protein
LHGAQYEGAPGGPPVPPDAPPAATVLVDMICEGPDPIVVVTFDEGRFLYANDAVTELCGIPRDELLGRTLDESGLWTDPADRATVVAALMARRIVDGLPLELRTPSGEDRVTHLWVRPCTYEGRPALIGMVRDTTESSHTEQLLAVEHAVIRLLDRARTTRQVTAGLLATVGTRLDWELGAWWAPLEGLLHCTQLWRSPLAELPGLAAATEGGRLAMGEDLPGWVWEHARPVWVADPAADQRVARLGTAEAARLRAVIAFPVRAGTEVLGVVEFYARGPFPSDDALLETADAIGRQAGQRLRSLRLEAA